MGKSAKKSNIEAKVAAAPVPEPHVKSAKKGKRDAEEAIDKVMKVKKQKIVEEVVTKQKDVKKPKKASREPPPKKKPNTSSSEDVTSSDSEKETEAKVSLPSKKLPATVAKNAANVILKKKQDTSDSSDSDSSSDEEMKPVIPISKTSIPISRKKPESSDSSSESDSEEKYGVKVAKAKVPVKGISSAPTSVSKKNKEASDSSEDDSDSDSDDDKTRAPSSVSKPITKVVKKDSSSDEDDSSDDEPSQPIQNKKTPMSSNLDKPGTKAVIKGIRSDEDESDSSEESSDDEPSEAQQNKKTTHQSNAGQLAVKASKPAVKAVKKDSSSDEDTDSEESSDDEPSKKPPNKATVEESSDESTDDSDGGPQHKKIKTPVPSIPSMSKTTVTKKDSDSDEDEDDNSEESSDDEPSKAQQNKKETDVKMKDANGKQTAPISEKKGPKTPAANQSQASGSKTLFVGNLSYHIERDEVSEFFSQAGEVVGVRLATSADGSLRGFGHVEFATEEDAQKALEEMNGQELSGRAVRLDKAPERGTYTPNSGKEDNSYQKGGRDKSQTIFIRGFDTSHEEDQIRTSLEEHFGSCGEITRVSIPMDYGTGASKGIAYMEFKEQDGSSKAMELNGSELEGHSLTVELAKPKGDSRDGGGRSGGGRSGGWRDRDSGGRFGGRDGGRRGRDGGGRFGGRRGRDGGDRGRGRGYNRQSDGAVSTGKKIKFGED